MDTRFGYTVLIPEKDCANAHKRMEKELAMDRDTLKRILLILGVAVLTFAVTALCRVDIDKVKTNDNAVAGVYLNLGDVCIYMAVFLLGGPWTAAACAVGSAFADLAVGSAQYIVGTLLVKAGMAFFIAAYFRRCDTWKKAMVVAALAEGIMVLGYFVFNLVIRAQYAVAAIELPLDLVQGLVCGALGMVVIYFGPLIRIPGIKESPYGPYYDRGGRRVR